MKPQDASNILKGLGVQAACAAQHFSFLTSACCFQIQLCSAMCSALRWLQVPTSSPQLQTFWQTICCLHNEVPHCKLPLQSLDASAAQVWQTICCLHNEVPHCKLPVQCLAASAAQVLDHCHPSVELQNVTAACDGCCLYVTNPACTARESWPGLQGASESQARAAQEVCTEVCSSTWQDARH